MSSDPPNAQELEFERRLLRSAEGDNPAHDTRAAWQRFSALTAYVASRAETVSAVHRVDKAATPNEPSVVGPLPGPLPISAPAPAPVGELVSVGSKITLSGVGLGMLMGAALSAGVSLMLQSEQRAESVIPAPSALLSATSTSASALPATTHIASLGASAQPVRAPVQSGTLPRVDPPDEVTRVNDAPKAQRALAARAAAASLDAQVRLLDRAREALRSNQASAALGWVRRARVEFPQSVLTPDWDFVEIEALRLQGEARAEERARAFLRKYPTDPHAHDVRRGLNP